MGEKFPGLYVHEMHWIDSADFLLTIEVLSLGGMYEVSYVAPTLLEGSTWALTPNKEKSRIDRL